MEFLQLTEGNLEEEQVNDTSTDNIKTNTRVKNEKYQICLKVACHFTNVQMLWFSFAQTNDKSDNLTRN